MGNYKVLNFSSCFVVFYCFICEFVLGSLLGSWENVGNAERFCVWIWVFRDWVEIWAKLYSAFVRLCWAEFLHFLKLLTSQKIRNFLFLCVCVWVAFEFSILFLLCFNLLILTVFLVNLMILFLCFWWVTSSSWLFVDLVRFFSLIMISYLWLHFIILENFCFFFGMLLM